MSSIARLRLAVALVTALAGCRSLAPSAAAPSLGIMPFPVDQVTTQAVALFTDPSRPGLGLSSTPKA